MIRIKVPATTANIGPCFDSCGIAVNLYNYFEFDYADKLIITGCDEAYANEDNLVYTSYKAVFEYLNKPLINVSINISGDIPVSRGLGSSSTCIVGGVMGANALLNYPLSEQEVFELCTKIEGHPDNVAPALFGGLIASMMHKNKPYSLAYKVDKSIKLCALIPDFELKTSLARSVLPSSVAYRDAVSNVAYTAISLKAWEEKNYELLKIALKDHLHQPYRSKLIDEYDEVINICEECGYVAAFISGAGPTIMTIYEDDSFISKMEEAVSSLKNKWKVQPLSIEMNGATKGDEK